MQALLTLSRAALSSRERGQHAVQAQVLELVQGVGRDHEAPSVVGQR